LRGNETIGKVTIIGAGITGLSAAFRLHQLYGSRIDLTVLESGSTAGGVIASRILDNSIIEEGPESFTTLKPAMIDLCAELGLSDKVLSTSSENACTLVAQGDTLQRLPEGFVMFAPVSFWPLAFSNLFTLPGKLRMLMDLILPKSKAGDESIAQFVRRRLGSEALDRAAEPLLSGVFGASAETLSAKSTIPQMVSLESKYGSIIRGLWKQRKQRSQSKQCGANYSAMVTLDEGLDSIMKSLLSKLPAGTLRTNCPVLEVTQMCSSWQTRLSSGETINSDAVIIACPATAASEIVSTLDPQLSNLLSGIQYSNATIYNFLFEKKTIASTLQAFGFVVPGNQRKLIKACSFSSMKFPVRTPADLVLLRVFTASEDPKNSDKTEAALLAELADFIKLRGDPVSRTVRHHRPAIPKYSVGHEMLVSKIEQVVNSLPGLALSGNAYHGMGLPDCVASANEAALKIGRLLEQQYKYKLQRS
jgi:protoporphyrinogen/coproporphyrinogen III oxidase